MVPDVLFEALSKIVEADKLWTQRGRRAALPKLMCVVQEALTLIINWDLTLTRFVLHHVDTKLLELDCPDADASDDADLFEAEPVEGVVDRHSERSAFEAECANLDTADVVSAFTQFLEFARKHCLLSDDMLIAYTAAKQDIVGHISQRRCACDFLGDLRDFIAGSEDMTCEAAVVGQWVQASNMNVDKSKT